MLWKLHSRQDMALWLILTCSLGITKGVDSVFQMGSHSHMMELIAIPVLLHIVRDVITNPRQFQPWI